jgi:hypothetical protein
MLVTQLKTNWCSKYMSFIAGIYQLPLPEWREVRRPGEQFLFPCGVRIATDSSRSSVDIPSVRAMRAHSRIAATGNI